MSGRSNNKNGNSVGGTLRFGCFLSENWEQCISHKCTQYESLKVSLEIEGKLNMYVIGSRGLFEMKLGIGFCQAVRITSISLFRRLSGGRPERGRREKFRVISIRKKARSEELVG